MRGLRRIDHDLLVRLRPAERGERVAAGSSAMAERGAGWLVTTLLAHRSPRFRSAGHHGMAGWATASLLAFLVKSITDRPRPVLPDSAGPAPSSSSMPSSHTAGAFGYATAASATTPLAAPVTFGLAGLIAWSRMATGRHFPTDVAVGAAIGIAGGSVSRRLLARLLV